MVKKRNVSLCTIFLSIFIINAVILAIPIQNDDFLESNEFFAQLLGGVGWTGNKGESYSFVPPLSNTFPTSSPSVPNIRAGIQSQYSVPGWVDTRWKFRQNITAF